MRPDPKTDLMHALSRVYATVYAASRALGRAIPDAQEEARMAVDDFTNAMAYKLS